jgi:hypothetical protein
MLLARLAAAVQRGQLRAVIGGAGEGGGAGGGAVGVLGGEGQIVINEDCSVCLNGFPLDIPIVRLLSLSLAVLVLGDVESTASWVHPTVPSYGGILQSLLLP